MLKVSRLRSRPRQFHRLVGLSVEEFDVLLEAVGSVYPQQQALRLGARPRIRDLGAGRPLTLTLEERLLSTLLYYRLHLTGFLLSCLFELDASNLWRERNWRMAPLLQEVLPTPMQDHFFSALEESSPKPTREGSSPQDVKNKKPRQRIGTLKELFEAYPELRDVCVDATEQQVPTPKNKRKNRQFYSGKSHCHTIKTQLTTAGRLVLHIFGGNPGNIADRQVLKASGVIHALAGASSPQKRKIRQGKRPAWKLALPRRVRLDRGYSGLDKIYRHLPGVEVLCALKGTSRSKVTALGRAWKTSLESCHRGTRAHPD